MIDKLRNATDTFAELVVIYLVSSSLVAFIFHLVEDSTIADAYYFTFVTGLTIGYGDISPETVAGKVLALVWAHFMVLFFMPVTIGRVVNAMIEAK